jgi:adhesin/invasin
LGGASVTVNGAAAPLFYASPSQINLQIPAATTAGAATVVVTAGGKQVATGTLTIQAASPGLFMLQQGRAAVVNQDGTVNSADLRAPAGSEIAVYLTGLGVMFSNPSPAIAQNVSATIGGKSAAPAYAGPAPGYVGLNQVNLIVPSLTTGDYAVSVSVGGVTANTAIVSIQ